MNRIRKHTTIHNKLNVLLCKFDKNRGFPEPFDPITQTTARSIRPKNGNIFAEPAKNNSVRAEKQRGPSFSIEAKTTGA